MTDLNCLLNSVMNISPHLFSLSLLDYSSVGNRRIQQVTLFRWDGAGVYPIRTVTHQLITCNVYIFAFSL
jgi:hypothetical protein